MRFRRANPCVQLPSPCLRAPGCPPRGASALPKRENADSELPACRRRNLTEHAQPKPLETGSRAWRGFPSGKEETETGDLESGVHRLLAREREGAQPTMRLECLLRKVRDANFLSDVADGDVIDNDLDLAPLLWTLVGPIRP